MEIPYNPRGILRLCFDASELIRWQKTQTVRHRQGFTLDLLSLEQLRQHYPEVSSARSLDGETESGEPVVGAIYAPQDWQLDPVAFTQALIAAATPKWRPVSLANPRPRVWYDAADPYLSHHSG